MEITRYCDYIININIFAGGSRSLVACLPPVKQNPLIQKELNQ